MTDEPQCTLDRSGAGPTTCYCLGQAGCQWREAEPVCVDCGNPDCLGDCRNLHCPCGGDCWDERPAPRPIERVTVAGELL